MSQAPLPSALSDVCDVIVIGGGPAGSTAAALLARQGRDVLLVEKATHPRFHIGESLLPANGPLFDRLGLREQVEAIGMRKHGVEFVSPQHAHRSQVDFADAWDKSMPYAWQVRRSELDELLFRHAAACGARTLEGCQVQQVAFDNEGASLQARQADGTLRALRARFVIDASGRDTLLARQRGAKQKNPRHDSAALYAHFRGARRLPGAQEGNISIFWFQHGWFWFIPLADGCTSVGAVCWPYYLKSRSKPLQEFFFDTIALAPALAERLQAAELVAGTLEATGNYSYGASHASGDRYLMLGDAYAFIDPVFSSGVYLAMASAFAGVELVEARLDRPRQAAAARRRFEAHMRRGPREFSWFIYRMTNPTLREMFMHPRDLLGAKAAVTSMLAGDIFGASPIRSGLRVFKGCYRLLSALEARRTWRAWRQRRVNIGEAARSQRDVQPAAHA
jgi:flavin-dependent dehydrogenase